MAKPEDKIVKIVDESVHTRGASVEQVGSQGALVTKSITSTESGSVDSGNPLPVSAIEYNTNDIDEASATVTYIGTEAANGAWYIKKIDTSSGTSFGHATVTNNSTVTTYSIAWGARTSLTYSNYGEAF